MLQPVPASAEACQESAANSVLQPLVVMSWPFWPVLKVPSFQTASSYAEPLLKRVVPPTARMSGAEAG